MHFKIIFVKKRRIFLSLVILISIAAIGQVGHVQPTREFNTITTAVPFLTIDANAQSMGTGWIGVVASDLYTQNGLDQNPALLSRVKRVVGFQGMNYVPWLRQRVPNINLYETGYYYPVNNNNALGFSARYFSLGDVQFTDDTGHSTGSFKPFEFAVGLRYAHNFSEHFSMGAGIKYIHSDLTGRRNIGETSTHPADAIAGDLGFDYRRYLVENDSFKLKWNAGLSFSNIGNKVNYTPNSRKEFLPQTIKLGTLFTLKWKILKSDFIACDFSYQADKLLVPTPPLLARDAVGNLIPDGNGGNKIERGMNPDVNALQGAFQSFYDAPGGLNEELREVVHHFGTEARVSLFDNIALAAIRGGYVSEHITKGNRKFITLGAGLGIAGFRLDIAYLLPNERPNSLENTWSASLGARFNLDKEIFFRFRE